MTTNDTGDPAAARRCLDRIGQLGRALVADVQRRWPGWQLVEALVLGRPAIDRCLGSAAVQLATPASWGTAGRVPGRSRSRPQCAPQLGKRPPCQKSVMERRPGCVRTGDPPSMASRFGSALLVLNVASSSTRRSTLRMSHLILTEYSTAGANGQRHSPTYDQEISDIAGELPIKNLQLPVDR